MLLVIVLLGSRKSLNKPLPPRPLFAGGDFSLREG